MTKLVAVFASGMTAATLITIYLEPLCGVSSLAVGFAVGVLALGVAVFVSSV